MAKKILGYIKLQLPAGKATPQPPVGPALGQYGVAIPVFTKAFNEQTKNDIGLIIPVVITVYADKNIYKKEMGVRSKARLNFITPGYSNLTISQINTCF